MIRVAACLAVGVLSATPAWSQISVEIVPATDNCKQLHITNTSDHVWEVRIPYYYRGTTNTGSSLTHEFFVNVQVAPRSFTRAWPTPGSVDCAKPYEFRYLRWDGIDITARDAEARRRVDQSRADVIQSILDREADVKRQNDAFRRQQEAEAEARRVAAANRQSEQDRVQAAMQKIQQQQQQYRLDGQRAAIDNGDARCRSSIDYEGYLLCMRTVEASDEEERRRAATHANAAPAPGPVGPQIGYIDPNTCAWPVVSGQFDSDVQRANIDAAINAMLSQCRHSRGQALANQRQQSQNAAALVAQQAEDQRRAEARQQAMRDLDSAVADARANNADSARRLNTLRDSNDELRALLEAE